MESADARDDDVGRREPAAPPVERGRVVAEPHLDLERVDDARREAARPRRLDEAAGRVDRRSSGRGR